MHCASSAHGTQKSPKKSFHGHFVTSSRPSCCQLRAEGLYEDYDMARHQLGTNWALDQQKKGQQLGRNTPACQMTPRKLKCSQGKCQQARISTSSTHQLPLLTAGRMISEGAPKKTVMITEDDHRGLKKTSLEPIMGCPLRTATCGKLLLPLCGQELTRSEFFNAKEARISSMSLQWLLLKKIPGPDNEKHCEAPLWCIKHCRQ